MGKSFSYMPASPVLSLPSAFLGHDLMQDLSSWIVTWTPLSVLGPSTSPWSYASWATVWSWRHSLMGPRWWNMAIMIFILGDPRNEGTLRWHFKFSYMERCQEHLPLWAPKVVACLADAWSHPSPIARGAPPLLPHFWPFSTSALAFLAALKQKAEECGTWARWRLLL